MSELFKKYCKGDRVIWAIIAILMVVSILAVYSSSTILDYRKGLHLGMITFRHIFLLILGFGAIVLFSNIPPRFISGLSPIALFASIALVGCVLIGLGANLNGSSRWINIGFVQFQPSEMAKIALIIYISRVLSIHIEKPDEAFWHLIIVIGITAIPILFENLSTFMLIVMSSVMLMIIGRISIIKIGLLGLVAVTILAAIIALAPYMKDTRLKRAATWRARIERFIDTKDNNTTSNNDENYQAYKARIAVATGGLIGKGFGHSDMKNFLPMAFSDFIFAIIMEEYGIWGAIIVAACYVILVGRSIIIAKNCEKAFHAYAIIGLAFLFMAQATINMLVSVGLMPVTGQTLPMVSMGGTSNAITGCALGIMLSISAQVQSATEKKANEKKITEEKTSKQTSKIEDEELEETEVVNDEQYDEAESVTFSNNE